MGLGPAEDRAGRCKHPLWARLRYMATPVAPIDLVAILPTWLTRLLHGNLRVLRYTVIRRGEHPDAVYFIDEGRVVIRHPPEGPRIALGAASFLG